jgi:hypothetical protein
MYEPSSFAEDSLYREWSNKFSMEWPSERSLSRSEVNETEGRLKQLPGCGVGGVMRGAIVRQGVVGTLRSADGGLAPVGDRIIVADPLKSISCSPARRVGVADS